MTLLRLPNPDPSPDDLADWAELGCLFGDSPTVSAASIADFLEDELGLDDVEEFALTGVASGEASMSDEAEVSSREHAAESRSEGLDAANQYAELALRQLAFRAQVVGSSYPIDVSASGATRRHSWRDRPTYAFLALLGARLLYRIDWPFHVAARLFERVVTEALRAYLSGEAVRFGWPRLEDETIEDFVPKVKKLARRMGEDVGKMRNIGPDAKDYDLDVIAWRPFRDPKTPGQLVVVCQCAIGQDWTEKLVSVRSWEEVIAFNISPLGALAFPAIPSRDPALMFKWHDITSQGNLPLDRLRLASLLVEESLPTELLDDLRGWIGDRLPTLPYAT
jgi:hypothetical protein